jgi:hypothetical protein
MTIDDYLEQVSKSIPAHPEWRYGQTLFNVLYDMDPELGNKVRATRLDPYYANEDDVLSEFIEWVTLSLDGEAPDIDLQV